MRSPRIDVLLPVRCARRTLPSAVGDVLGQTRVDVRIIAVVDERPEGGDDGSAAWLEDQSQAEGRLIVLHGPGRGPGAALDRALTRQLWGANLLLVGPKISRIYGRPNRKQYKHALEGRISYGFAEFFEEACDIILFDEVDVFNGAEIVTQELEPAIDLVQSATEQMGGDHTILLWCALSFTLDRCRDHRVIRLIQALVGTRPSLQHQLS